jgi:glycosyltransferase involved in cell wall biosynthesis
MPPVHEWVDPLGVPVRLFGGRWPRRWRGHAFALGVAWTLWTGRRDYQVAYFLMSGLQIAVGVPLAALIGKSVIMKFSGSSTVRRMKDSWLGRLELRMLRRWASSVMLLNPGMMQEADDAGFDRAKMLWMPNPVDIEVFRPLGHAERGELRQQLGLPGKAPVAAFVGRLAPEKELVSLLRAMPRIVARHPDACLVLVGDGPSRGELEQCVRQLGIERNVLFPGPVDSLQVPQWLQASDVFTLVSSLEGLPCSLIEAMAVGLPSVVSDIPAMAQLIDSGVQGLVAKLKDEDSVAEQLLCLFGDAALRARMGAAARRRVLETYSTDKVVARYETLFENLLRSGSHR